MVSDEEIASGVETLLRESDPNIVTSLNGVVQQLEQKLGLDLSHKAAFIRDQINLLLRSHPIIPPSPQLPRHQLPPQPQQQHLPLHHQQIHFPPKDHFALRPQFHQFASPHFSLHHPHQQHHVFPQDLNFRQPHAPPPQPQHIQPPPQLVSKAEVFSQNAAPVTPKESTPVGAKRRGGPGGLNKVCGVSPQLQAIVGHPALPRTEIVKQLWAYIRKNNLQDPSNKRKIICDDALRVVFETDCTDMFKMNKLLAKHITALEPTKESSQAKRVKVDVDSTTESTEQPAPSTYVISEALAKFLGIEVREMTVLEACEQVREYIAVNHLEDPLNKMVILCDEKLRDLLGCESISALGVDEMLKRHHLFKHT